MSKKPIEELPGWVKPYVKRWRKLLNLRHIDIRIIKKLAPVGDPNALGAMSGWIDYNSAFISLRADIEDTKKWRKVVLHEIAHVAHARVQAVVTEMIIPQLPADVKPIAHEAYRQAMEAFIDSLADTFYELDNAHKKGADNDRSNTTSETAIDGTAGTTE